MSEVCMQGKGCSSAYGCASLSLGNRVGCWVELAPEQDQVDSVPGNSWECMEAYDGGGGCASVGSDPSLAVCVG